MKRPNSDTLIEWSLAILLASIYVSIAVGVLRLALS